EGWERHDELLHLVADYFRLATKSDAVSIRFEPAFNNAKLTYSVGFEGPLRFISVGKGAFTGAAAVREAIVKGLAEEDPVAVAVAANRPVLLRPPAPRPLHDFEEKQ